MALDTREKRASAINWFTPLPLPDGTVGEDDRFQVSWVYVGGEAAPPTTLRLRVTGRQPATAASGRQPSRSVSGRQPSTSVSGMVPGN